MSAFLKVIGALVGIGLAVDTIFNDAKIIKGAIGQPR